MNRYRWFHESIDPIDRRPISFQACLFVERRDVRSWKKNIMDGLGWIKDLSMIYLSWIVHGIWKSGFLCPEVIYQPAQVLDRIKSLRTHRNYPGEVESGTPTCLENPARSILPIKKEPKLSIIDGDLRHVSLPQWASQTSGCLVFWGFRSCFRFWLVSQVLWFVVLVEIAIQTDKWFISVGWDRLDPYRWTSRSAFRWQLHFYLRIHWVSLSLLYHLLGILSRMWTPKCGLR